MVPRKFAVWTSERRKRPRQVDVVCGNIVGRESEDGLDHCWANNRCDGHNHDYHQTKNREFVFQQTTPRIAPQRRATHECSRFVRMHIGLSYRHLRANVDEVFLIWILLGRHFYFLLFITRTWIRSVPPAVAGGYA